MALICPICKPPTGKQPRVVVDLYALCEKHFQYAEMQARAYQYVREEAV
jgi:hypothetical protein